MNITRRDALMGASAAAVVTTAITASLAIKADQIAETPAKTLEGLAVKLRLIAEDSMEHPMDSDFEQGLIRSTVESAERLAGEVAS